MDGPPALRHDRRMTGVEGGRMRARELGLDESAVRFHRALARDYFETCRAKQQTASASPAPTA